MCESKYSILPLFFLAVPWNLSNIVIYLFSYYKFCLSIIWQTVGVQYKYAFDVRNSQCGRTVSEGVMFLCTGGPWIVLILGQRGTALLQKPH